LKPVIRVLHFMYTLTLQQQNRQVLLNEVKLN
jgi:hypothetical protein